MRWAQRVMTQPGKYPAGMIRYLGLNRWWMSEFTEQERALIESTFSPLGLGGLTQGDVSAASDTPRQYLRSLAGWLDSTRPDLAERIRTKSAKVLDRRKALPR
jgi:hypothetical protein